MSFFDQLNTKLSLSHFPRRIISLVPSQTELLFHLGLEEEVVGITKFCIHPSHWLSTKTIVGGTKNFRFDIIDDLKPDLIIGNKEENYLEGIEKLREKYPVWVSDIITLQEAFQMIGGVGTLVNKEEAANKLVNEIFDGFEAIKKMKSQRVLYLIWKNPWMGAASNTFIHSMLETIGLNNCLQNKLRYPEISSEDIAKLNPEIILLSSEPFPFQEKHIQEIQVICPSAKIFLVDGEMFSWYGSRLRFASAYFNSLNFVKAKPTAFKSTQKLG